VLLGLVGNALKGNRAAVLAGCGNWYWLCARHDFSTSTAHPSATTHAVGTTHDLVGRSKLAANARFIHAQNIAFLSASTTNPSGFTILPKRGRTQFRYVWAERRVSWLSPPSSVSRLCRTAGQPCPRKGCRSSPRLQSHHRATRGCPPCSECWRIALGGSALQRT
jgi:hypothetical protein